MISDLHFCTSVSRVLRFQQCSKSLPVKNCVPLQSCLCFLYLSQMCLFCYNCKELLRVLVNRNPKRLTLCTFLYFTDMWKQTRVLEGEGSGPFLGVGCQALSWNPLHTSGQPAQQCPLVSGFVPCFEDPVLGHWHRDVELDLFHLTLAEAQL